MTTKRVKPKDLKKGDQIVLGGQKATPHTITVVEPPTPQRHTFRIFYTPGEAGQKGVHINPHQSVPVLLLQP